MNRIHRLLTALLLMCIALANAQELTFSMNGGFYDAPFELTLSCDQPDKVIHFTTDGNQPTATDSVYTSPLLLDENLYSRSNIYSIQNCLEKDWYLPDSIQKKKQMESVDLFLSQRVQDIDDAFCNHFLALNTELEIIGVYKSSDMDFTYVEIEAKENVKANSQIFDIMGRQIVSSELFLGIGKTETDIPFKSVSGIYNIKCCGTVKKFAVVD